MASHAPAVTGDPFASKSFVYLVEAKASRIALGCNVCSYRSRSMSRLEMVGASGIGLRVCVASQSAHWSRCASLGCQTVPGQWPPLSSTLTASVSNVTASMVSVRFWGKRPRSVTVTSASSNVTFWSLSSHLALRVFNVTCATGSGRVMSVSLMRMSEA